MNRISEKPSQLIDWDKYQQQYKAAYTNNECSFIKGLTPNKALELPLYEVLEILYKKLGSETFSKALNPEVTVASPIANHQNSDWLKKSNMVGINVRTIGNFFNIIKYLLTVPASQDSVHILPIWEPGVVSSLYGKTSWLLNKEFFSTELATSFPNLNTTEKQLKVVTNLIHALGKTVGLDVIPHTDRFSEIVIQFPSLFEWVIQNDGELISITNETYIKAEDTIWDFLVSNGPANNNDLSVSKEDFFNPDNQSISDDTRQEILFGPATDFNKRLERRLAIMNALLLNNLETLPVTMAPPYRGLHIDKDDFIQDEYGTKWYNYHFDKPEKMSRVFGPLTRYKFYDLVENSQELDFDSPNIRAWNYINRKYAECQKSYNFDFMRGDMAHVQARKSGVPNEIGEFYDPLAQIKKHIQTQGVPYFAFFAETFLAPPNQMGYGDECLHLEAIDADATLGDLQASIIGSQDFYDKFNTYTQYLNTYDFAPNFTLITADKDDPRFDEFYRKGNHLRLFIGLFLSNMPSYMSLGFETRNLHEQRGKNEEYSKLYVFQINDESELDKVTHGPFEWGINHHQFEHFTNIRVLAEEIWQDIVNQTPTWIEMPNKDQNFAVWSIANTYIFVSCFNPDISKTETEISSMFGLESYDILYNSQQFETQHQCLVFKKNTNF